MDLEGDIADAKAASPSKSVRLLPRFDQYIVGGPRDESGIVPDEFKDRVYRSSCWLWAVLLVDGAAAGVWEDDLTSGRLEVQIGPFRGLPRWARKAAEADAERLAEYSDAALDLHWND